MTSATVRQKYLDFFTKRGHQIIAPAPLVPENDPTTLFTSAGMQQLVPYLKGELHPTGKRLVDSQPSIRTQDIDQVGDISHTTFFEMLGNWSLGDYFKKEQLPYFLEFLTSELQLAKEKLQVTVFEGTKEVPKDSESAKIWEKLGIPRERIFYYPPEKNWWAISGTPSQMVAGDIGGPDSEVFYDFGPAFKFHENSPYKKGKCHPNCQCGRFLEIGNSVFIEYQKNADGTLSALPQKNVDFGAGLERLVAVTNGEPDIFQIDLFSSMIQIIEKISGKSYKLEENKKSIRIIADHLRAAAFLIANGVEPANVAQGYILRRLIRRAIRHGRLLGISNKLTSEVAQEAIKGYTDTFPELTKNREKIRSVLLAEEEKFQKTLDRGLREWDKCVNMFRNLATIPGEKAFYLYESFGFPPELIQELASERGMKVDMDGFQKALISHQKLSQTASAGMFKGGLVSHSEGVIKLHTATHLLQAALKIVLGQSIHQAGSNITSERLRFDFPYPQKLTPEQIRKIEEIVNQKIRENLPVKMEIMPLSDAKKQGALGFFEKKYQDKVKVYSIGGFSKEICGGPHVDFTGKLGSLKIIKEEKVSSSLRRIYAALNH